MNISNIQATQTALSAVQGVEDKRAGLQIALLKKSLDSQKDQAALITQMIEGKGQNLDIRV